MADPWKKIGIIRGKLGRQRKMGEKVTMSCYVRHIPDFMEALNLEDNKENRKRLDLVIRKSIGMGEANHCPEVWARLKPILADQKKKSELLNSVSDSI